MHSTGAYRPLHVMTLVQRNSRASKPPRGKTPSKTKTLLGLLQNTLRRNPLSQTPCNKTRLQNPRVTKLLVSKPSALKKLCTPPDAGKTHSICSSDCMTPNTRFTAESDDSLATPQPRRVCNRHTLDLRSVVWRKFFPSHEVHRATLRGLRFFSCQPGPSFGSAGLLALTYPLSLIHIWRCRRRG